MIRGPCEVWMLHVLMSLALFVGCEGGPTFANIEAVKVTRVGTDGLHKVELGIAETQAAVDCMYRTKEVSETDSESEILPPDVFLVEVKDNAGIRSFELFTRRHLKGNKGKHYRNECIYAIVKPE